MTKYTYRFIAFVIFLILYMTALATSALYGDRALRGVYYAAGLDQCPKTRFDGNTELSSQFYEDYVLSYVFRGVDNGFYVDVGANDPNVYSATKYFHDKGWRGMNLEPQVVYYNKFVEHRPGDININKAASNNNEPMVFYIPKNGEVFAGTDPKIETMHKKKLEVATITVDAITLTKAFNIYGIKEIDFIKIDVEGHEGKVLEGLDLSFFRPKVIVLESISPTNFFGYLKFEPIMFENGYKLGMSDDLNRYYYRKESPEFAEKFREIGKCVLMDKLLKGNFCQNEDYCPL